MTDIGIVGVVAAFCLLVIACWLFYRAGYRAGYGQGQADATLAVRRIIQRGKTLCRP